MRRTRQVGTGRGGRTGKWWEVLGNWGEQEVEDGGWQSDGQ